MSVSDSKVTQKFVENTVFEHIGAGASTPRSNHKDLDFDALISEKINVRAACAVI